jgi:uncharacterized protein (UPF0335 family)
MMPIPIAAARLKEFVARIERMNEEKAALSADVKEIFAEAKALGLDTKVLRKLIAERKCDADDVREEQEMLDTYRNALTQLADTPLGRAAIKQEFGEEGAAA